MSTRRGYVAKQFLLIGLVLLLCLIFLGLGLVIGYGIIGDGKNPFAILSRIFGIIEPSVSDDCLS